MTTIPSEGATLNPTDLTFVDHGYAVNRVGPCERIPAGQGIDLYPALMRARDRALRENAFIGAWLDSGEYVIDIVDVYVKLDHAMRRARERGQRYVGDIANNAAVAV